MSEKALHDNNRLRAQRDATPAPTEALDLEAIEKQYAGSMGGLTVLALIGAIRDLREENATLLAELKELRPRAVIGAWGANR